MLTLLIYCVGESPENGSSYIESPVHCHSKHVLYKAHHHLSQYNIHTAPCAG